MKYIMWQAEEEVGTFATETLASTTAPAFRVLKSRATSADAKGLDFTATHAKMVFFYIF